MPTEDPADQKPQESVVPNVETTISFGTPESTDSARARVALSAQESALVQALPDGTSILIAHQGPGSGSRFLLDTDAVTAGRSERADIFLDDATVSRKHAVFERADGGFRVRDVGSLNGTYLNRERIDAALLHTGDEVQIGKFRLTYYASPQSESGQ
ncbi:FHA domain-containing protein [Rarobacter incanus]|uniref:PSer/pThr/pTyr-binding forkhead associated (FHA) protein n=1 Tax=Rarobacter incanus TaxID=153494 RepID=A0A542SM08_9MICO|nr:FHA domain-containing protein [Rarobacter incanus]TQK75670.1 pSer/pThr/pTyr-binding forkhead associated (FHA) protein [Rarobacter incanus]